MPKLPQAPLSCRRPRRITSIRIIIKSAVKTDELATLTLYTYAFLTGWGAFLERRTVSEVWEECHLEEHIHLLEMRTVIL
jgi:hypothetical protein